MKIALCQINPAIGALSANAAKILDFAQKAHDLGAHLAVFPELSLTGYPPRDLLEKKEFVEKSLQTLHRVHQKTPLPIIVGFVDFNRHPIGKPLHNAAGLLVPGESRLQVQHKTLLPSYDVFDETRYFEPGQKIQCMNVNGKKIGVLICEDSWAEELLWEKKQYHTNPMEVLSQANPDFYINISASPYSLSWFHKRVDILSKSVRTFKKPLLYVNQVGGNDQLIFDGASLALNGHGDIVSQGKSFKEDMVFFDLETQTGEGLSQYPQEIESCYQALQCGLSDYVSKCGFKKVVLGLSGGIDSALVATLACDTLGPQNVLALFLPSPFTSRDSFEDSKAMTINLNIQMYTISIDELFKIYRKSLEPLFKDEPFNTTEENIQARIRGTLLMALSNKWGHLLLSTGNKSELAMGYCTLYGDMSGGLSILGDCPKTLVYALSKWRNSKKDKPIPQRIIDKPPSAELRPNQKDEDSLPPYSVLDPILKAYVEDHASGAQMMAMGYEAALVKKIVKIVDLNEYKRFQSAPTLRITTKAFGMGRRFPIAQGYTQEEKG
ncbi:MAG: NAD+ synthase [Deltaproteobacteria bacterium]|nr:NAD+ synthase [Deltaproteobacteria bacterium]